MHRFPKLTLVAFALLVAGCSKPAAHDASIASDRPGESAAPAAPATLEPLSYEQEQAVTELLIRKAACDRFVPGFRERCARSFERWRALRPDAVAAIESRPSFTSQVAEMERVASQGGTPDGDLDADAVQAIFENEGRPADAALATPQGAWTEFLGALSRADRARALACLSAAGRAAQHSTIESLPEQTLRETGGAFVRFEPGSAGATSADGTAFRSDGTSHAIVFDRAWNGDWRITSF